MSTLHNMPPEIQPQDNRELEALLVQNDQHNKDVVGALETLIVQNEGKNVEPLLETQIVAADKNAEKIVAAINKKEGIVIKLDGVEVATIGEATALFIEDVEKEPIKNGAFEYDKEHLYFTMNDKRRMII